MGLPTGVERLFYLENDMTKKIKLAVRLDRCMREEIYSYDLMGWDKNTTDEEKEEYLTLWMANYVEAWMEEIEE